MRLSLGLLLVGTVGLVACSGNDSETIRRATPEPTPASDGTAGATGPSSTGAKTPAPACPTGMSAPTTVSATDKSANDIHVIAGYAVFHNKTEIVKVALNGTGRTQLYTSPDLVHSFSDGDVIVTIESPNAPDAVLKVMPAGPTSGKPATAPIVTTPEGWLAGGTTVFGSDQDSFYVQADVANVGDTIYKVNKANPAIMTQLAQLDAPLTSPQLVGSDVWFVRDAKRVYKVVQTTTPDPKDPTGMLGATTEAQPPTEIFGLGYANCNLAVGGNHAFCSTGSALEQRDLSGANLLTVFDASKGTAPSLLGGAMFGSDTVFVQSLPESATDPLKHGIRAVKSNGTTADEKLVACGREAINGFAVDSLNIVWSEEGKGVFTAVR